MPSFISTDVGWIGKACSMALRDFPLPVDLPVPVDDGAANHLPGATPPGVSLAATDGATVNLGRLQGRWVIYTPIP